MWSKRRKAFQNILKFYKTQMILVVFLSLILVGTVLLCLPVSSADGRWTPFADALFTATSATCVTGLVVRDTAASWSIFGQVVILLLIQVGGLGFMTMATMFSLMIRRTVSFNERLLIKETLNADHTEGLVRLTKHLFIGTILFEAAGALLLSLRFVPDFGLRSGIYKAVFHSISAFCNAGFDIMEGGASLSAYVYDPLVNGTLIVLIVVGGLGFVVWEDFLMHFCGKRKLTLHTKIVLTSTLALLCGGALLFFITEYHNPQTMGAMNVPQAAMASLFHSASCRTAGFFTISMRGLTDTSKLLSVLLMFVGGAPGSTAGGVKVVTVFVLFATALTVIKGRRQTVAFGRTISQGAVMRAVTIIMIHLSVTLAGVVLISCQTGINLADVLFEAFSASGTTGLSAGITPFLPPLSRAVLIALMFFGRVGVLTSAIALMQGQNSGIPPKIQYPEEKIIIG